MQLGPMVPTQVPPVQLYELAMGVQLAVSVEVPPAATDVGDAVRLQTGVVEADPVTVTVAMDVFPVPYAFAPVNA